MVADCVMKFPNVLKCFPIFVELFLNVGKMFSSLVSCSDSQLVVSEIRRDVDGILLRKERGGKKG